MKRPAHCLTATLVRAARRGLAFGAFVLGLVFSIPAQVSEDKLPPAEWLSISPDPGAPQTNFFRRTFVAEKGVVKAVLLGACDQRMTVYLNGAKAAELAGFQRAESIDVTGALRPGTNLVAVRVKNEQGTAVFRLMLELATGTGRQRWIVSDSSWLASTMETGGWNATGSTPQGWRSAFAHGEAGLKKWGDPFHATRSVDAYNSWMLASGSRAATDPATMTLLPGFKVELLRSSQPGEGSWIAMAFDPKGRLTVARESRGLLRMTLSQTVVEKVEVIEDTLLECRGLLYAYDSLYVNANNSKGFYRLRDTDGNDRFDEKQLLLATEGGLGHGRNQITLGPDGLIYLSHGNDVMLSPRVTEDSPMKNFADDQLLLGARKGHGPGLFMPPAGHVLQTDREGKTFRLIAGGFRNMLDVAFNAEGEMFTYDSDNERFIGAPWYVPTRVLHVVSGGDYGWRRGTDVWPTYYPDSLPGNVEIGVGSPTGIEFGTRSHYPRKYQESLFIADWAYGRILAVHLKPQGASYTGAFEPFLAGRPLNVTDLTFGPDGAMYFVTGGRATMSGLYRVSYPGGKLAVVEQTKSAAAETRALRRRLEALHVTPTESSTGKQNLLALPANSLAVLWPHLGHPDQWIRHAARVALENHPLESWQPRALAETNLEAGLTALLALARLAPKEVQPRLLGRLAELPLSEWNETRQLEALRIYALSFIHQGRPGASQTAAVLDHLEPLYPSARRHVNHELCRLLVYLKAPNVIGKTIPLLAKATASEELLYYLSCLRHASGDWTPEQRQDFFVALARAEQEQGSRDYLQELKTIRKEVIAGLSAIERESLGLLLVAKVASPDGAIDIGGLQFVKEWKLEDLAELETTPRPYSLQSGRKAFHAAQCSRCHRFGVEPGGVTGPDLTSVAARFSRRDLLDAVLNPSKTTDDKFRNVTVALKNGETVSGAVEHEDVDKLLLNTGDENVEMLQRDIVERKLSDISPMPEGLINVLTREQVFDLLAWLESGASQATPQASPPK